MIENDDGPAVRLCMYIGDGESWLQVPLLMLSILDFHPSDFTTMSRMTDEYIYLYDFDDARKFVERLRYVNQEDPDLTPCVHPDEVDAVRALPPNPHGTEVLIH